MNRGKIPPDHQPDEANMKRSVASADYGRLVSKSYFEGCSNGGRHAMRQRDVPMPNR